MSPHSAFGSALSTTRFRMNAAAGLLFHERPWDFDHPRPIGRGRHDMASPGGCVGDATRFRFRLVS